MDKKTLAERLNISKATLYNWEKDKPELIRLINYGLQYEIHKALLEEYLENLKKIELEDTPKLQL